MFWMKKIFLLGLCAVILAPLVWVLTYRFEGSPPEVTADLPTRFLKDGVTLSLDIIDHKPDSGIFMSGLFKMISQRHC